MADGLAKGLALVHIGHQVVDDGLGATHGQGAPAQSAQVDAFGVDLCLALTQQGAGGHAHVAQAQTGARRRTQAHADVLFQTQAGGAGFDHQQAGAMAFDVGRDHEELGRVGQRHHGFDAVDHVLTVDQPGAGLQLKGVEQGLRLLDGQGGGWGLVAREGAEVSGLLLGRAPLADGGAHGGGGQAGKGQAQVALGQGLRDQGVGDGRAFHAHAIELFGNAHGGHAQLGALGQQLCGCSVVVVGLQGGRAQLLHGEVAHGVDDHGLLVGGREVEQVGRAALGQALGLAQVLDGLEGPAGGDHGTKAIFGAVIKHFLGGFAQAKAVQGGRASHLAEGAQADTGQGSHDGVPMVEQRRERIASSCQSFAKSLWRHSAKVGA